MKSVNIPDPSDLRKSHAVLLKLSPTQYRLLRRAAEAESGVRGEEVRVATLARHLVVRGAREILRAVERAAARVSERKAKEAEDDLPEPDDAEDELDAED